MVDKWTYLFHAPARGDVVVFIASPNPSLDYVKRIIGLPGDVITIHNTTVIVDGVTLHDTFVKPANQGNPFADKRIENMVVPPNDYFVLGDNRADSSDSRDWGFLPRKNIIGRAALIYWPLRQDNDGLLPNVSSVFANIYQHASTPPTTQQTNNHNILETSAFCITPVVVVSAQRRRSRKYDRKGINLTALSNIIAPPHGLLNRARPWER